MAGSKASIAPRADLAGVAVGEGTPVAVMGALNVSPESFYAGSVHRGEALRAAARAMVAAGAAVIDIGARSTAPYLPTGISEEEEGDRLAAAVRTLVGTVSVPVSADTARPLAARAALEAGARILNDVTGLRDPDVAGAVARHGAAVILMASPARGVGEATDAPIPTIRTLLTEALARARRAGIPDERIVLDPGIGFFRGGARPWHEWDVEVLAGLGRLGALGRPFCVGVSRKSFIGAIIGAATPAARLAGSLAATALAVFAGATLVRTHDVRETVDAVRVAERVRRAARG